ncbi:hypothetical protein T552_00617 [Pneumocystis carinii B80]|uniref:AP-3 complex subunit delta n=1 Tax=Pneumocystis carinii (strain B80) TaxID=1408658 RepID=A0A0W4ZP48_PNEC8|nr:hypothetical protein T552_00617 [Pneumocystis carinii B80]KTW30139.1 hypothetical protein T552_00617 [Pneumocystis carinii B80]
MFEKSLTDFIRGLRVNKNQEKYIQKAIIECRNEVKSLDLSIKTMAILKLSYIVMFGHDISWASFNIIEVMSSTNFFQKRIGYMASCLTFRQDTDVLVLSTNLIKKDLTSSNYMDVAIAINALSEVVTPELSRDLLHDLCSLMNHSSPYIRKRVVLMMYKVFLQYPDALRTTFSKLCKKLEDPNKSVVCATINVICELSFKNPKNYLQLVPIFYNLLKTSSDGWLLIKLVKIFSSMIPLEPRLVKKLIPVLTTLIQDTSSMSLRYECINIMISGKFLEDNHESDLLTALCMSKLKSFFEVSDQNLKYVGLLALSKLMITHPTLVLGFKDIILECFENNDVDIRLRSLDLIECLVNKDNLPKIIKYLMSQLSLPSDLLPKHYRVSLVNKIISISSKDSYANILDFNWYILVLTSLVKISKVNVAKILGVEMQNASVRVKTARPYSIKHFSTLLYDPELIDNIYDPESNVDVLSFVAWIVGEYSSLLDSYYEVFESMLLPKVLTFSTNIQKNYIQAIPKIFVNWILKQDIYWNTEKKAESLVWIQKIIFFLDMFCTSKDFEVSQRAIEFREIFRIAQSIIEYDSSVSGSDNMDKSLCLNQFSDTLHLTSFFFNNILSAMFLDNLNPVVPKAQRKIPIVDLDLENWIYPLVQKNIKDSLNDFSYESLHLQDKKENKFFNDSFYISEDIISTCHSVSLENMNEPNNIPIVKLEIHDTSMEKKGKYKLGNVEENIVLKSIEILPDEAPENILISDSESEKTNYLYNNKSSKSVLQIDTTALQKFNIDEDENNVELLNKIEEIKKTLKHSKGRKKEKKNKSKKVIKKK